MSRSRRVSKSSIIQYEELKAAAGGSGSGGGGHGAGTGLVNFFKVSVPPPLVDRVGAGPSKFRLPKLEARTKYGAGQIIFFLAFAWYC